MRIFTQDEWLMQLLFLAAVILSAACVTAPQSRRFLGVRLFLPSRPGTWTPDAATCRALLQTSKQAV